MYAIILQLKHKEPTYGKRTNKQRKYGWDKDIAR